MCQCATAVLEFRKTRYPSLCPRLGVAGSRKKNAEEGSGLVLPIVKGLVELHGGTFTLKSKLREGTEVIVIFPPERVMNASPATGEENVGSTNGRWLRRETSLVA